MVTATLRLIGLVVTANADDRAPCATTTFAGTPTSDGFELRSATTAPPLPAGTVSATAPVVEPPPTTPVLPRVTPANAGATAGVTVKVVVLMAPPKDAATVVDVVTLTAEVPIAKFTVLVPC